MRSQTYRTVSPIAQSADNKPLITVGRLFVLIILAIVIVVAMRWYSSHRVMRAIIPQDAPPAGQVMELNSDLPNFPVLRFTVKSLDNGGLILTDVDGDRFLCMKLPTVLSDMEHCPYAPLQR